MLSLIYSIFAYGLSVIYNPDSLIIFDVSTIAYFGLAGWRKPTRFVKLLLISDTSNITEFFNF